MAWVSCQTKLSYKYRRRTHTVTPALEESYLRVDVSCSSEACDSCRVGVSRGAGSGPTASMSASAPYYLIPDDVVLSDLLELFELPDISNYIILASCVKQVALQSGRKASRLRALYRDRRRRAVLFDDVHCLDTAASAAGTDPSLPPALAAGLYYSRHLGGRIPLVVVSDRLAGWTAAAATATAMPGADGCGDTDDVGGGLMGVLDACSLADNMAEALAAGVTVLSAAEYVSRCWTPGSAVSELFDSLTAAKLAAAVAGDGGCGDASYTPHLSQQEVEDGLVAGTLMRGVVHISRRSPTEAVVELGHGPDTALGRLVRVSGRAALNRAMQGDVVAVRILPPGGSPASSKSAVPTTDAGATADLEPEVADAATGGSPTAATPGGGSGAAAEVSADADFGAELLADPEGNAAGGEEGALAMMETTASASLPAAEVVAVLQRDPRDIVACLSQRDEAALRARLEQQQQPGAAPGGPSRRPEVLLCIPLDRRLPAVVVVTRQGAQLAGNRFVVRVDSWERNSRFPRGHVTRVLGRLNDLRAESEAVLVQCGIHHKPFCEAALLELPRVVRPSDWVVPAAERAVRRDLTGPDWFVVSIDPVGCTDVDDAMHVRFLPYDGCSPSPSSSAAATTTIGVPGLVPSTRTTEEPHRPTVRPRNLHPYDMLYERVEVGVHIADVSWFVAAGGMLDGEARDRCTSVYLVDRRLDMLPGLLSEQLCSLREGVERLAVSVIWTLRRRRRGPGRRQAPGQEGQGGEGAGGGGGRSRGEEQEQEREREGEEAEGREHKGEYEYEVEDAWFGRTIIRSRHQLHYQQAQDILDSRPPAPSDELPADHVAVLRRSLRVLDELAGQLHSQRVAAGALELASAELRFRVDEATGAPCQVICKQKIPMMDVVAEMMIAANAAVAERIATAYPSCALLRNHPPPRAQAFEQVRLLIEPHSGGVPIDPASNASLAAALERACAVAAAADPAAAHLIKSLATRAMSEAQYSSSGTTPPGTPLSYHYGLALQYYTHFTSPIRRYADIVVHRQLLAALAGTPPPQLHPDLAAAAHTMNVRHRQAKAAQKECSELYLLLLLHAKPHVERALVCSVSGNRLELFIPAYHLRGAVALTDRRGLPRPPMRPGEPDNPEADDDVFAAAARRQLCLATSPDSAAIIDAATGAVVWSVRLWQPVSVRLFAAGHRAHGPKLAMRLLDPSHPDALSLTPPVPAAVAKPVPAPAPLNAPVPSTTGTAPTAARGAAPMVVASPAAAAAGPGGAAAATAALPPHLRLLISLRDGSPGQQDRPGPRMQQEPGGGGVLPHGGGAASLQGQGLVQEPGPALQPKPSPAVGGVSASGAELRVSAVARSVIAGADGHGGEALAVLGAPAEALAVLGAPAEALTAAVGEEALVAFAGASMMRFVASENAAPLGSGCAYDGKEPGRSLGLQEEDANAASEAAGLRSQLRRISRLEMRLLACRRGSIQERRLQERLSELRSAVHLMQA